MRGLIRAPWSMFAVKFFIFTLKQKSYSHTIYPDRTYYFLSIFFATLQLIRFRVFYYRQIEICSVNN